MYSTFPSFCRQPPDAPQRSLSHATPQLVGRPPITRGSGLRHSLAGSPTRPAESRSLSYGPMVHLRLLSTPPRGDAVTLSYRPENAGLEGTCTPLIEYTLRRTRADAPVGPSPLGPESFPCRTLARSARNPFRAASPAESFPHSRMNDDRNRRQKGPRWESGTSGSQPREVAPTKQGADLPSA